MSSSRPAAWSYAAVLQLPHARRTFAAALAGRLGYGVVSLSLVLSLARATGSLSVAGLLATAFAATGVALAPARAALIDRWGARRALPALVVPFTTGLFALAACAHGAGSAPRWLLAGCVAATGCSCPPLGPTMRALWAAMAPDEDALNRAFSLDAVAEELLFLVGPLIAVAVHPVPGLVLSGTLIATGALAMVSSPAATLLAPTARAASVPVGLLSARGAGVRRAAYAAFGSGCCQSAVYLFVIAAADRARHPAASGWILAAESAGSALGGLVYGRIAWRRAPAARLPHLLTGIAALAALAAAAPGLALLAACVAAAGLLQSPTLSTAYLAAARQAPAGTATRATTWVNSAVNAGSSAGGALAALLLAHVALPAGFLITAAVPLAAAWAASGVRLLGHGARGGTRAGTDRAAEAPGRRSPASTPASTPKGATAAERARA